MLGYAKKIVNFFIIGVLIVIPFVIVIHIILFLESTFRDFIFSIYGYSQNIWITVLAFALTFVLLAYIGFRFKNRKFDILHQLEDIIDRIPLIGTIYRVIKKLVQLFGDLEEHDDREVVYIEYPKDGLWVPGYITNREGDMYVVYVPTSPNPTSGFTVIVHESKIVRSAMNLGEVTSFIVSVGIDLPKTEDLHKLAQQKNT